MTNAIGVSWFIELFQVGTDNSSRICDSRAQFLGHGARQNALSSSIGDSKLSDMTLISVERNLSYKLFENPEPIIDVFASKSRRLELSL